VLRPHPTGDRNQPDDRTEIVAHHHTRRQREICRDIADRHPEPMTTEPATDPHETQEPRRCVCARGHRRVHDGLLCPRRYRKNITDDVMAMLPEGASPNWYCGPSHLYRPR
jgi:hypothetical protein